MLGALICMADMTQVFTLNMTYDVPVKLFSFHLFLMALFLAAPDVPRLFDFFLRNRTVHPSTQPELFTTVRGKRAAVVVQVVFGIALIALNAYGGWKNWSAYGGARPKSPLYGIWEVQQLTIDGQEHPPLLTDKERWRRVIFDFAERVSFQRMDDSYASYGAAFNMNDKTLALTKSDNKDWKASLNFLRPAPDQITLNGTMDGHQVQMQLHLFDRSKFLLVNRGFHWIQENPFNR